MRYRLSNFNELLCCILLSLIVGFACDCHERVLCILERFCAVEKPKPELIITITIDQE